MLTPQQRLKFELMAHGLTITPEARSGIVGTDGSRPLTLNDYPSTSGIALELEGDIWVNAPIYDHNPNFVDNPVHRLELRKDGYFVCSDEFEIRAKPMPVPSYHNEVATTREPYIKYAITHTDRVRISPIEGCSLNCSFCDMSFKYKYRTKPVEGLIESVHRALQDKVLPARHIMISGGTPHPKDFDYLNNVYEQVAEAFQSTPLDVMMTPVPGLLNFEFLKDAGVSGLSINMELFNDKIARKLMPMKSNLSRKEWTQAIDQAVKIFGQGSVRSLLLLGLESVADTVKGVEFLAKHGVEPVLSPFRPDPTTPLSRYKPPSVDFMSEVYNRSMEVCARYGMKLGLDVSHVSTIHLLFQMDQVTTTIHRKDMAKNTIRHLISIDDFSTAEIVELLDRAEWHRIHETRADTFKNKTAGLLFMQPSTRTRVGFHVAICRLGGQAVEINETKYQEGMDRAESLSDTIRSVSSYFDIIVMRHSSSEELKRAAILSSAPVINGGSGTEFHPTQTLIDLFAIRRRLGKLKGLRIGLAGDLSNSRAASSLLGALQHFAPAEVRIMAPVGHAPPRVLLETFAPDIMTSCNSLKTNGLDVLYMAGFPPGDERACLTSEARIDFYLTPERVKLLPDHGVVLCPLPRIDEIDTTVDASPKAGYFVQSTDGLYVRMAVLEMFIKNNPVNQKRFVKMMLE